MTALAAISFAMLGVLAGVMIGGYGEGTEATLVASLAGRPIGILATIGAAVAFGLQLPSQIRWREVVVLSLLASIGLTFTLYFAIALFPAGPLLAELKLGALLTTAAAPLAFGAACLIPTEKASRSARRPRVRAHPRCHRRDATAATRQRSGRGRTRRHGCDVRAPRAAGRGGRGPDHPGPGRRA